VAAAITRAIFDHAAATLTMPLLLASIDIEEVITHGSSSGIDAAAVSGTQPVWFVKGQACKYFSTHASGFLVIGDSGVKGNTGHAVASVRTMLADPETGSVAQEAISHLGELAYTATVCLQHDEMDELGLTMNRAQAELMTLGVSHPALDRLTVAARQAGALGAKLTGGGQGGCMIALAATEAEAERVAAALRAAGAVDCWIEPLTGL
jgi:mevalonate kinase